MRVNRLVLVLVTLLLASVALAQGKPSSDSHSHDDEDVDYGDLYVLLRDVHGVPITTNNYVLLESDDHEETVATGEYDIHYCLQPISYEPFTVDSSGVAITDYLGAPLLPCTEYKMVDGALVMATDAVDADAPVLEEATSSELCAALDTPVYLVPIDAATCSVLPGFEEYVMEPEFGRLNSLRTTDAVMNAHLLEMLNAVLVADEVNLDPTGRFQYTNNGTELAEDGIATVETLNTLTVDSHLQNASGYLNLMKYGCIFGPVIEAVYDDAGTTLLSEAHCPMSDVLSNKDNNFKTLVERWGAEEPMYHAACLLGACGDKGAPITVDIVAHMNQFLGIVSAKTAAVGTDALPVIADGQGVSGPLNGLFAKKVTSEVLGAMVTDDVYFLDYTGFGYDRAAKFVALPDSGYITSEDEDTMEGVMEYLGLLDEDDLTEFGLDALDDLPLLYRVHRTPIYTVAESVVESPIPEFASDPATSDIAGFVQAADDSRAVLNFLHLWEVPEDEMTPRETTNELSSFFCLPSINQASGLQAPGELTFGTAREGNVAVANAGPGDLWNGDSPYVMDAYIELLRYYVDAEGTKIEGEIPLFVSEQAALDAVGKEIDAIPVTDLLFNVDSMEPLNIPAGKEEEFPFVIRLESDDVPEGAVGIKWVATFIRPTSNDCYPYPWINKEIAGHDFEVTMSVDTTFQDSTSHGGSGGSGSSSGGRKGGKPVYFL
ncbi:hypothetical protein KIPB_000574 [Kipferlia bialata]|uniref:Uncharacterized protein n=1 Tax=Kipferlia bialata TaxID=797122 RepID=A0A9K3GF45_9EUKA|nr:hypothetical protein KIPB_000574 [Kipferlia bialata]|eukprot:g574.t1